MEFLCAFTERSLELFMKLALPDPTGPPVLAPAPKGWIPAYHATFSDPMDESHTLDNPFYYSQGAIRLLNNDTKKEYL